MFLISHVYRNAWEWENEEISDGIGAFKKQVRKRCRICRAIVECYFRQLLDLEGEAKGFKWGIVLKMFKAIFMSESN